MHQDKSEASLLWITGHFYFYTSKMKAVIQWHFTTESSELILYTDRPLDISR